MDVFLTLDYELFLGDYTGTVEKCLIDTMDRLADTAERAGARFTLFVDVTYLLRLRELKPKFPALEADWHKVTASLSRLAEKGHDIQLHIHPQWAYSDYVNGRWQLDQQHYKISDIDLSVARRLFADGCALIEELTGKRPVGFRAGGFSAQPTGLLKELLLENGLSIDSSVYPGNKYDSPQQKYDYLAAPSGRIYRFDSDINTPDSTGPLAELPLTVCTVSPLFYWRLVFQRLSKQKCHRRLGDGHSVKTTGSSIRQRLLHHTQGFATIDESKISYLWDAYVNAKKKGDSVFCVIGHPKLATEYSLRALEKVLKKMSSDGAQFKTLSQIQL